MSGGGTDLYANFFVRVYDMDLAEERFFFSGVAQQLDYLEDWSEFEFRWDTSPGFPSNYVIEEVHANIWGLKGEGSELGGGVYLDSVVPLPEPGLAISLLVGTAVLAGLDRVRRG
jgi:hypothetical protein